MLWVVNPVTYPDSALVAQVSNLLYRGFPIRNDHHARTVSRLEVGDTAGWKPAPRQPIYTHVYLVAVTGIGRNKKARGGGPACSVFEPCKTYFPAAAKRLATSVQFTTFQKAFK